MSGTDDGGRAISRRVLVGGGLGVAAVGALGWFTVGEPLARRVNPPQARIPADPAGQITYEQVPSRARGQDVGLWTAVPAGHGDGADLPVCLVLHGASATTANFTDFGLGRFLTAAVRAGAPPFALVGVDGGRIRWQPNGADDPAAMLRDELPGWVEERGFGPVRLGWGWSMGGFGILSHAAADRGDLVAVAAFSPALSSSDSLMIDPSPLDGLRLGIWCGTDDALEPTVREFVDGLPEPPAVASFSPGGHTRAFWNDHTVEAFRFLGGAL